MPDQIREEHDRAAQERDDDHFVPAKILLNLAGKYLDALGKLFVSDEDALDFLAPARRDGVFSNGHAVNRSWFLPVAEKLNFAPQRLRHFAHQPFGFQFIGKVSGDNGCFAGGQS